MSDVKIKSRKQGRKKSNQPLYQHIIAYRASDSMMQNIIRDIESNRPMGIRNKTDVIDAALNARYTGEDFWAALTRRLDRTKRSIEKIELRLMRFEEMFLTFLQYYFIQYPVFSDDEKESARLRGNVAFNNFTKALTKKIDSMSAALSDLYEKKKKGDEDGA